jgi:two-component system, cell cycle sensor histidine kinase and response regulator CckA
VKQQPAVRSISPVELTFRTLCGKNPLPMWICDMESLALITANETTVSQFRYTLAELRAMTMAQLCPGLDRRALHMGAGVQTLLRAKNGFEHAVELNCSSGFSGGQGVFFVVARPVADFAAAQRSAREKESLLNSCNFAVILTDVEDRVTLWNKSAETLYGWTAREALGRPSAELTGMSLELFETASREVRAKGTWMDDGLQKKKDGTPINVNSRWSAVHDEDKALTAVMMVNLDITEQKNLEAQYLRSQRLESIGTLASGIAHDLNNILTPILMSVGIMRMRGTDEESAGLMTAIEESAERGADIVRQVLTFARGVAGEHMVLQPRHLIGEMAKIAGQTFPKNIKVLTMLPKDLWMITGDATQIHQVLLNLAVNARDAMPEGGTINVEAENFYFDQLGLNRNREATAGPYVLLKVSDTGHGIPAGIIEKIFDPFFTTKGQGKGTGLGLATVRGIIKNHNGILAVESEPGKGTTFNIYLPATLSEQGDGEEEEKKKGPPRGQGEVVLVVDDEPGIRTVATRTLQAHGYEVYAAEDGSDAMALYFQRRNQVDLVVTDVMMEQMDGVQLVQALRRIEPDVRVIVSSGHCSAEKREMLEALGVTTFLDKPYKPEQLLQMVHQEIHGQE